jgi:hypothetical protein
MRTINLGLCNCHACSMAARRIRSYQPNPDYLSFTCHAQNESTQTAPLVMAIGSIGCVTPVVQVTTTSRSLATANGIFVSTALLQTTGHNDKGYGVIQDADCCRERCRSHGAYCVVSPDERSASPCLELCPESLLNLGEYGKSGNHKYGFPRSLRQVLHIPKPDAGGSSPLARFSKTLAIHSRY